MGFNVWLSFDERVKLPLRMLNIINAISHEAITLNFRRFYFMEMDTLTKYIKLL